MGEQQECGSRKIVERGKEINIFFLLNQKFISNVLFIFFVCIFSPSMYIKLAQDKLLIQ
jgi:hypothetical protein